jgi:RNA polymerase primary sigma factor
MTREERNTWTYQEKYRFRKVEAKRYRVHRPALIERSLVDLLVAEHPTYDGGIRQIDLRHSVERTLELITPREEKVVRLVLGIGIDALSLAAIGELLGCSSTRVCDIYHRALRKLRHPARSKHLRDFLVTA